MNKSNPHSDRTIRPFRGDTRNKVRSSAEDGSPSSRQADAPPSDASWTARLKRRWESMLAWLARGAGHACPT